MDKCAGYIASIELTEKNRFFCFFVSESIEKNMKKSTQLACALYMFFIQKNSLSERIAKMSFSILPWSELAPRYDGTILLGNGASIAVSPRFAYGSLFEHVTQRESLEADVRRLFEESSP